MKKINVLWTILGLIFVAVFNLLFFTLGGFEHSASVWISYVFIHIAYLMLVITPFITRKNKTKTILGFPLYTISAAYFVVEFIIGVVFIFLALKDIKIVLLVQFVLAGIYGALLIANLIANEYTTDTETEKVNEVNYIKESTLKLKKLLNRIDDTELRKTVESVYDILKSSPVKSHEDVTKLEENILKTINDLELEVLAGNNSNILTKSSALIDQINDRNNSLKKLK